MSYKKICEESLKRSNLDFKQLSNLLEIAKNVSIKGGKSLMENFGKISKINTKTNIGDLVTNADLLSEKIIIEYLNRKTPEIQILAEESGRGGNQSSQLIWCIDPLDGTTNYAHGYPFFATSIGLCFEDIPLLGAIYIPFIQESYYGAPTIGSFCNGRNINVSKTNCLEKSLLVTGFSYDRKTSVKNNYSEFCWMTNITRGVRRGGAAAVDLAFIANGRLDGYWERGLAKWDMAAGVPIVENAGGIVRDFEDGNFNLSNGKILACTPAIENEMLIELKKTKPINEKEFLK